MYNQPDQSGHFKEFGGKYVPEILIPAIKELEKLYTGVKNDPQFMSELDSLLKDYSGRPTPLYYASRISEELGFNITIDNNIISGSSNGENISAHDELLLYVFISDHSIMTKFSPIYL